MLIFETFTLLFFCRGFTMWRMNERLFRQFLELEKLFLQLEILYRNEILWDTLFLHEYPVWWGHNLLDLLAAAVCLFFFNNPLGWVNWRAAAERTVCMRNPRDLWFVFMSPDFLIKQLSHSQQGGGRRRPQSSHPKNLYEPELLRI